MKARNANSGPFLLATQHAIKLQWRACNENEYPRLDCKSRDFSRFDGTAAPGAGVPAELDQNGQRHGVYGAHSRSWTSVARTALQPAPTQSGLAIPPILNSKTSDREPKDIPAASAADSWKRMGGEFGNRHGLPAGPARSTIYLNKEHGWQLKIRIGRGATGSRIRGQSGIPMSSPTRPQTPSSIYAPGFDLAK